jgi:hypothetical protein
MSFINLYRQKAVGMWDLGRALHTDISISLLPRTHTYTTTEQFSLNYCSMHVPVFKVKIIRMTRTLVHGRHRWREV